MSKIITNKEGKTLLSKEGKVYKINGSGRVRGLPIEVTTSEEMEAALVKENVGKIYKFVGETNEVFTSGRFYEVIDDGSSDITDPTFVIQDVEGASYGFILDDNGYYVSTNQNIDESAALCKVLINNPNPDNSYKLIVECVQLTEDYCDYGLLSNLDTMLLLDFSGYSDVEQGLVYKSYPSDVENDRVEYLLPTGGHYITIKYTKDVSVSDQNDAFKFKVYFEQVEEPEQPSEPDQPTENVAGWYVDGTGEFIPWATLISNGRIHVSGNSITSTSLSSLSSGRLIIDETITSIDLYAFSDCSSLESIIIPNSVTLIGHEAFRDCSSLTSITIPNSVTSIGGGAFYKCSSLTNITIPDSVTSIGDYAFCGCSSLASITIPNSVTSISSHAFSDCSSLTSIVIPNSVTSISSLAFENCSSLISIAIPNSVTNIEYQAFLGCSSLTIYCEASSKPSEWSGEWNLDDRRVYWAGQWHYDENGNPTPGSEEPNNPEILTMTIRRFGEIQYEKNMTWMEWLNSDYNTHGLTYDLYGTNGTRLSINWHIDGVYQGSMYYCNNCSRYLSVNDPVGNCPNCGNEIYFEI